MLISINLSLSALCGADCLFCPHDRASGIKQKIMPFEYAKKIVDEISSEKFKQKHDIKQIEVGENGDGFLNKDIIEILRYTKQKLPKVQTEIFTNFQNFTEDKAKIIINEKLVDSIWCNIDGSNRENYYSVKRLNIENTKKNLMNFIKLRNKSRSKIPIRVFIISLHRYIHTIYKNFGFYPMKVKDKSLANVSDDTEIIKKQLNKIINVPNKLSNKIRHKILGRPYDWILTPGIYAWAERDQTDTSKIDYSKYSCPILNRVETEAFIASDGTWYACCMDGKNEFVFGNVIKESIDKVYESKKRKESIQELKERKFKQLGGPCKTVNCCQVLN